VLFAVSVTTAVATPADQRAPAIAVGRHLDALGLAVFPVRPALGLTSPFWARQSDRRGRKPLIMIGMAGFMVSMLLCALVVSAGLRHWATPGVIFLLFLFARAIFGAFGSAANPASQAYMAERTSRADRTKSMSALAGAFGLGTVVGPFVAPLFVLPGVGLAGPLFAFAILAAVMLFVVHRYLPESGPPQETGPPRKRQPGEPQLWRDRRVFPS
jgi:MFS family permease